MMFFFFLKFLNVVLGVGPHTPVINHNTKMQYRKTAVPHNGTQRIITARNGTKWHTTAYNGT
jgi:hypothetical protein